MKPSSTRKLIAVVLVFACSGALAWAGPQAQSQSAATPSGDAAQNTLANALAAACRQQDGAFAAFLTADNAAAFQALPSSQRTALMQRFVLLANPGKALLTTNAGQQIVRCASEEFTTEMRLGEPRVRDNLAFISLEIAAPGDSPRKTTLGLVRENGNWKVLSLGLVLLDIPALAEQWSQADLEAREQTAIDDLRQLAIAINTYRNAFGKLPESLTALGPAEKGQISPDTAGLVDADLASGSKDGYAFRYTIVPARDASAENADKAAGFALAGTPSPYGKTGHRSFLLDSGGILRGGDKQGGVATADDPRVDTP